MFAPDPATVEGHLAAVITTADGGTIEWAPPRMADLPYREALRKSSIPPRAVAAVVISLADLAAAWNACFHTPEPPFTIALFRILFGLPPSRGSIHAIFAAHLVALGPLV